MGPAGRGPNSPPRVAVASPSGVGNSARSRGCPATVTGERVPMRPRPSRAGRPGRARIRERGTCPSGLPERAEETRGCEDGRIVMIVLVLGGARSGKSQVAEELAARWAARSSGGMVTFVATAVPDDADADFAARIEVHRSRRPAGWETVELQLGGDLGAALDQCPPSGIALVDSLGTWLAGRPGFAADVTQLRAALNRRRSGGGAPSLSATRSGSASTQRRRPASSSGTPSARSTVRSPRRQTTSCSWWPVACCRCLRRSRWSVSRDRRRSEARAREPVAPRPVDGGRWPCAGDRQRPCPGSPSSVPGSGRFSARCGGRSTRFCRPSSPPAASSPLILPSPECSTSTGGSTPPTASWPISSGSSGSWSCPSQRWAHSASDPPRCSSPCGWRPSDPSGGRLSPASPPPRRPLGDEQGAHGAGDDPPSLRQASPAW